MNGQEAIAGTYRISSRGGQAPKLSPGWFTKLPGEPGAYLVRSKTDITPHVCGSATFPAVCNKLLLADQSIEISVWIFDPAVCLRGYDKAVVENPNLFASLPKTELGTDSSPRIGDILLDKARKGVKVKLLVWDSGDLLFNVPRVLAMLGRVPPEKQAELTGDPACYVRTRDKLMDARQPTRSFLAEQIAPNWLYRFRWYEAIREHRNITYLTAGKAPGQLVEELFAKIHFRKGLSVDFDPSEPDPLPALLRKIGPTHHQKTVMVDYERPQQAVGFVMGNNFRSVDYDSPEHPPSPENGERYPGAKPRQDIAVEVRGQALHDINDNFNMNWKKAGGKDLGRSALSPEDFDLANALKPDGKPDGKPNVEDKTQVSSTVMGGAGPGAIYKAYMQALSCCTRYIYIENQYFRYQPLVQYLKTYAAERSQQRNHEPGAPLFYFIVVNIPDSYATKNTYETLEELGHEGQMSAENHRRYKDLLKQRKQLEQQKPPASPEEIKKVNDKINDMAEQHPSVGDKPKKEDEAPTPEKAFLVRNEAGLKGHIATLMVCRREFFSVWGGVQIKYVYRPVDIHTKAMIVDDVFLTVGSANCNKRGMESDAEINISTTRPGLAETLRNTLFTQHFNGPVKGKTWDNIYEAWKDRLDTNWVNRYQGNALMGSLCYLYEPARSWMPEFD